MMSSTWKPSAPLARCGAPSRIARAMSATPAPRWMSARPTGGRISQSRLVDVQTFVSPSKRFPAPSSTVLRIPGGVWRVKGGGIGSGTMAECTVVSSNTCYANIMLDDQVGPERTVEMAHWLLANEGLFVGTSGALNVYAAAKVAMGLPAGARVVTFAP